VGTKLAERIVVELRDRAGELVEAGADVEAPSAPERSGDGARRGELVSALVNLQMPRPKAERVAEDVVGERGAEAPIEELVRAALQRLAR
jgi:Holliday junction resolvasome RuvABC DNA-binding subunit